MYILIWATAWIPIAFFFAPLYLLMGFPFVAYGFYEKFKHGGPAVSRLSLSSIPAMLIHKKSLGDFIGGITDPQKREAFRKVTGMLNRLLLEIDRHPGAYPADYSDFVVRQAACSLNELRAGGCVEAAKFISVLRRELANRLEADKNAENKRRTLWLKTGKRI